MSGLSSNLRKAQGGVEFSASAPGKVILHGEHSVVYGKLAIAASLGLRTKIHLVEIDCPDALILKILPLDFEHKFSLNDIQTQLLDKPLPVASEISDFNWELPKLVDHQAHLELARKVVNSFFMHKNQPPSASTINSIISMLYLLSSIFSSTNAIVQPLCITVDSELSLGGGTGSSASFSVATVAAFIHYLKLKSMKMKNISKPGYKCFAWESEAEKGFSERELQAISDWAFCGENIFHGTPSGLDNTICTYGNLVQFRKNHSLHHLTLTNPFNLLLINTRVPRETAKMVRHVGQLKETFPQVVDHIMDAMEDLTFGALEIIKKIDQTTGSDNKDDVLNKSYQDWNTFIQMNHSLLCSLGVSHQKLEEINMILERNGLKGKLTGAGGGGFAISVLPPSYDPEEVIRILTEHDFGVIVTKLGGPGVRID